MDNAERIRRDFETLLEQLRLRQLQGDGVYLELEALLQGLHEDGEMDSEPFDTAMALVDALPLGKATRHA